MKKILSVLACLLLLLLAFLPVGRLIATVFGYSFTLVNYWAFVIAMLVLTAVLAVLTLITKETVENQTIQFVFSALTPCALLNAPFYASACGTVWMALCLALCVGCGYLTIRHGKPLAVRAGAMVLTVSLLLPVALVSVFVLMPSGVVVNTVVQTVDSPSGAYYAQVIDNDQGALGGNTVVNVYTKKKIDLGLCTVQKKRQRVYLGEWGEHKTMELQWKDDHCLIINEKEYKVK